MLRHHNRVLACSDSRSLHLMCKHLVPTHRWSRQTDGRFVRLTYTSIPYHADTYPSRMLIPQKKLELSPVPVIPLSTPAPRQSRWAQITTSAIYVAPSTIHYSYCISSLPLSSHGSPDPASVSPLYIEMIQSI